MDLPGDTTEVYRAPDAGGCAQAQMIPFGSAFAPLAFPDIATIRLER